MRKNLGLRRQSSPRSASLLPLSTFPNLLSFPRHTSRSLNPFGGTSSPDTIMPHYVAFLPGCSRRLRCRIVLRTTLIFLVLLVLLSCAA